MPRMRMTLIELCLSTFYIITKTELHYIAAMLLRVAVMMLMFRCCVGGVTLTNNSYLSANPMELEAELLKEKTVAHVLSQRKSTNVFGMWEDVSCSAQARGASCEELIRSSGKSSFVSAEGLGQ